MRTVILTTFVLAIAAGGCARSEDDSKHTNVPADNTKTNERDRDKAALTPLDQGESEADRTITQKIRQAVVQTDSLSMTAKNVKIITQNGVVTLRGPVKSEKEKLDIGALAQRVEGTKRVDNQLEIAAN